MSALPTQVGALAQRSIMRTARQPASAIPPLLFPVALMLLNSGGLHASTELPGFPTDSFLAFALAVPFIQGALFSTMNAGTDLARDIQTGFFSRLSLTPVRGGALLAGQLAGIVALGVLQAVFYIACGLLLGVHFAAGPAGIALLLVYAAIVAVGFGAIGSFLALRTGSGEAIQGALPAPLRLPLHLVDEHAAQPDRRRLVPVPRLDQPDLLPDRVRPEPDHHGLGRARRSRSGSASRSCSRSSRSSSRAARWEGGSTGREHLARCIRRRLAHPQERDHDAVARDPVADVPAPLLHRLRRRPVAGAEHARLRLSERLHGVPVRVRAAPVGRVRRRLHRVRRRPRLRGRASRAGCCWRHRIATGSSSATAWRRSSAGASRPRS